MSEKSRRTVLGSLGALAVTGIAGRSLATNSTDDVSALSVPIEETDWPTKGGGLGRTRSTVEEAAPNGEHATLAWYRQDLRGSIPRELTVAGDSIYVTTYTSDVIGTEGVTALDAATGEVQWSRRPSEDSNGERRIGSATGTPAIGGGRLYVRSDGDDYKNRRGGFFALDTDTGETLWKRESVGTRYDSPIYYDETVFLGSKALDAETGETVWEADGSFLGITGGSVYDVDDGELIARNPTDGTVEHTTTLEVEPPQEVALIEGAMYFEQSGEERNEIVSLSLNDGTVQWRWTATPEGEEPFTHISKPAVSGGTVYVHVSSDNEDQEYARGVQSTVYALDASTGEIQWSFDTSTVLRGNPTVAGDTVYVGGHALPLRDHDEVATIFRWPTIHALATSDGTERWNYLVREGDNPDSNARAARTPTIANGRVVAGGFDETDTMDGTVSPFALDPNDVAPDSWSRPIASDAPVARITTDPENADGKNLDSGTTVTLDGSSSSGEVATYEWRLGGGSSFDRTGETTDVTMNFCGSLQVMLRVTGPSGEQTTSSVTLSTTER